MRGKIRRSLLGFATLFCLTEFGFSAELHFTLIEKNGTTGNRLLVVGGIHGDEPGGYVAATLLAKHYTIKSGCVAIVPNLNFDSIMANKRGIYGDMNRKFREVKKSDKDYQVVTDIKNIIKDGGNDLVLNLHDGHGFYRPNKISPTMNPSAWGQAAIIDQEAIPGTKFGKLSSLAKEATRKTNVSLVEDVHEFNVKNTETKERDKDMQLSLTWFAVSNNIPALAIETSKNISETYIKAFYHLQALEHFMAVLGIEYERDFELTLTGVRQIMPPQNRIREWLAYAISELTRRSPMASSK